MYLCGFTLFLSLILNRTYTMILDVLRLEEENRELKGNSTGSEKSSAKLANAGDISEIPKLKKENERLKADVEAMKKQSEGLSKEYNNMGDKFSTFDGTPKKDK
jgi:B-cell receptor-associated protein 31